MFLQVYSKLDIFASLLVFSFIQLQTELQLFRQKSWLWLWKTVRKVNSILFYFVSLSVVVVNQTYYKEMSFHILLLFLLLLLLLFLLLFLCCFCCYFCCFVFVFVFVVVADQAYDRKGCFHFIFFTVVADQAYYRMSRFTFCCCQSSLL